MNVVSREALKVYFKWTSTLPMQVEATGSLLIEKFLFAPKGGYIKHTNNKKMKTKQTKCCYTICIYIYGE